MSLKKLTHIVILSALAVVLRVLFGAFPNIKPLTAMFLISLTYLGFWGACALMAISMLVSGFLFGFGPVVLWQILSYGVVLFSWQCICVPWIKTERLSLFWQSVLAALAVFLYGFVISLLSAGQFGSNPLIFWLNGLTFDSLHAVSTFVFYPFVYHIYRRFYP